MRRREFITVLGSALAWPVPAHAQQAERLRRIGVLSSYAEGDPEAQTRVASLREGLRELGWTEGGNIAIDYRYAAGDPERARTYAAELVGLTPDLIFCHGGPVAKALQQATRTIPIVFANVTDPVTAGLVGSLARPGGNITGFANYEYTMAGKWLQILNEVAPRLSQVLVVLNPENPISVGLLRDVESVVPQVVV